MRLRRSQADRLEREVLRLVRRLNTHSDSYPLRARLISYNMTFSRPNRVPLWPVEKPADLVLDFSIRVPAEDV